MNLLDWGWDYRWSEHVPDGLLPARITSDGRGVYHLATGNGHRLGELSGRLQYLGAPPPVTGDWVAVTDTDPALIVTVLPRTSLFVRGLENGAKQPLAANADVAFLVTGLDGDFNRNRIERYLLLAEAAGVKPVIVLNKRDLHAEPEAIRDALSEIATTILLAATMDDVAAVLSPHIGPRQTAAILGSSGCGKSTIVNALLGESRQRTGLTTGLHVTTARSLIPVPAGWLILDMPGLRAVGLTPEAHTSVPDCRFRDCTHTNEPGCALRESLPPDRLANLQKLQREAEHQRSLEDPRFAREQKRRSKIVHKAMRDITGNTR